MTLDYKTLYNYTIKVYRRIKMIGIIIIIGLIVIIVSIGKVIAHSSGGSVDRNPNQKKK